MADQDPAVRAGVASSVRPFFGIFFVRSRPVARSLIPSFPLSLPALLSVLSGVSGANALSRSRDDCRKEGGTALQTFPSLLLALACFETNKCPSYIKASTQISSAMTF